jgi:hypothetical protein
MPNNEVLSRTPRGSAIFPADPPCLAAGQAVGAGLNLG